MQDSVVTPGRLTVMMPAVPRYGTPEYHELITRMNSYDNAVKRTENLVKLADLTDDLGRQLVHNILVRKGNNYIMNKNGTRLKPLPQLIFSKGMQRLASNESPEAIVRDLETQLLLIKGN